MATSLNIKKARQHPPKAGQRFDSHLVIACGALAKDIMFLQKSFEGQLPQAERMPLHLQCLPADYHNRPEKIAPAIDKLLSEHAHLYPHVLVAFGDCGTHGALDRVLARYDNVSRLEGAHCYAFFAGLDAFDALMEEELGSFFLTDYLVRHFDTLIMQGMGLYKYPELRDMYFGNYKRLVYLAQSKDAHLQDKAQRAAQTLGLEYHYNWVGFGGLNKILKTGHARSLNRNITKKKHVNVTSPQKEIQNKAYENV